MMFPCHDIKSLLQSPVSHVPSEIILICWFDSQKNIS